MIKSISLLTTFLTLLILEANAQYAENIRSGRPGVSIGPFTVGKGVLQNQSGYYLNNSEDKLNNTETNGGYFITVFRGGLTERFELGAAFSYKDENTQFFDSSGTQIKEGRSEGINFFTMALRSNVYEGKGLLPAIGYQINFDLPWLSEEFSTNDIAPRFALLTAQTYNSFRLITNWSIAWSGNSTEPFYRYSVFVDKGFGKKIRVYLEHYAIIKNSDWRPKYDAGITYLLNKDIQFDLQAGLGPDHLEQEDLYLAIGIGWRVRLKKRE